ncbi:MAG: penicillin acylase family protein [Candidatus Eremiobacteraeota bacterium]|nr:penicillin acylase family protein [Candidatus Eremiobacteraeota bacterium]
MKRLGVLAALALVPAFLFAAAFALWVYDGVRAGSDVPTGTLRANGIAAPVHIVRDDRGIPHVRARNERDLFFAEGYLQGTDRLFQLDIYRRLVRGRLGDILGTLALHSDLEARVFSIDDIAREQLAALRPAQRRNLEAFADGVNFAIATRPLPPEFRVLGYRPAPWTPQDSLAASFATVLALTDSWNDVATRADVVAAVGPAARNAFFSISDPAYDSPTTSRAPAPVAPLPPLTIPYPSASPLYVAAADAAASDRKTGAGSNEFTAGGARTTAHRALLANDPHLELRMPGVWWLAELEAPGLHVAGATLPGVPGIILGHNAHVAWGATNGTVATVNVYRERFRTATSDEYLANGRYVRAEHRRERFGVRFGKPVTRDYLRTRHGFVFEDRGVVKLAAAWTADSDRRSSFEQFDGLDRAASAADAMRALSTYPGPPQNFVVADDRGLAGYTLAGEIPIDDSWGIVAHDGPSSGPPRQPNVPFARLPHVTPARGAVAFTANDRMYGAGYPYRLSAAFSPPYRAASIARRLASGPIDVARFEAIQADVLSLPERDLAEAGARALGTATARGDSDLQVARTELHGFDGRFIGSSRGGVFVTALRRAATERIVRLHVPRALGLRYLSSDAGEAFVAVMRMLRERPRGWVPADDYDAFLVAAMRDGIAGLRARGQFEATWSALGARTAQHPLAGFGLTAWNGTPFPGLGDAYSPHVQAPANAQSFRAIWDVGKWQNGGMVIPQGESGQPGSPHYRDLAPTWLAGTLVAFPFGEAAVARVARETLELTP